MYNLFVILFIITKNKIIWTECVYILFIFIYQLFYSVQICLIRDVNYTIKTQN